MGTCSGRDFDTSVLTAFTSIVGRGGRPVRKCPSPSSRTPAKLFPGAAERQSNIIVQPTKRQGVSCVQLDDLDCRIEQSGGAAFMTLEASPAIIRQLDGCVRTPPGTQGSQRLRQEGFGELQGRGLTPAVPPVYAQDPTAKRKYEPDFPPAGLLYRTFPYKTGVT